MPTLLGPLAGRFATPHYGVLLMALISALVGGFGVVSVRALTAVTLLSSIGTFLIYGFTNLVALIAFFKHERFSVVKHRVIPLVSLAGNIAILLAIIYLGIACGGAAVWIVIGAIYLVVNSARLKRPILSKA